MVTIDRKRIGFFVNNADVGVIYYLLNLTKSLNCLVDQKKPVLVFFFNDKTFDNKTNFDFYPYAEYQILNEVTNKEIYLKDFFRKNTFLETLGIKHKLDGIFPILDIPIKPRNSNLKLISWVTDFQHKIYPKNFPVFNRLLREFRFKRVLKNADTIVLSSKDSCNNLDQFYRNFKAHIKVLNFVSLAETDITDSEPILKKYNITKPYFIISNQFYSHKNHTVVFEAIKILKDENKHNYDFVFTGKTEDYRKPKFFQRLMERVNSLQIKDDFKLLGLIPRNEQLLLMAHAEAIIQPSKFEGWNTSIEDAKNIQQVVICSEINVHQEQLGNHGYYFDPDKPTELVEAIHTFINDKKQNTQKQYPKDIADRKIKFAEGFLELFD
jgi:glycosyltransferase involved in cell wall biosynthesis